MPSHLWNRKLLAVGAAISGWKTPHGKSNGRYEKERCKSSKSWENLKHGQIHRTNMKHCFSNANNFQRAYVYRTNQICLAVEALRISLPVPWPACAGPRISSGATSPWLHTSHSPLRRIRFYLQSSRLWRGRRSSACCTEAAEGMKIKGWDYENLQNMMNDAKLKMQNNQQKNLDCFPLALDMMVQSRRKYVVGCSVDTLTSIEW